MSKKMELRDKRIGYNFDIGEGYTLDFTVARCTKDNGEKYVEVDVGCIEKNLSYDQVCDFVNIVAMSAYELGEK